MKRLDEDQGRVGVTTTISWMGVVGGGPSRAGPASSKLLSGLWSVVCSCFSVSTPSDRRQATSYKLQGACAVVAVCSAWVPVQK